MLREAAILATSLSVDALTAGFAYGSTKIKIPMLSVQVINLICCGVIGAAMLLGGLLKPLMPENFAPWVAFVILLIMGIIKLLDGLIKACIRRYTQKEFSFSVSNVKFILHLYANPEAADADVSADLSPREAVMLAIPLSLDGMAVGFAAVLAGISPWALLAWSFCTNTAAIILGHRVGNCLAKKVPFNISWLAGIALIALAFGRL
ncbi:MAG: manganese efflux pump [Defluviitaleaceae bacterium]|nr:manganese efflux pump [Defluviitaleaceae bacterium]